MKNLLSSSLFWGILQVLFFAIAPAATTSLKDTSGTISYENWFDEDQRWLFSNESLAHDILVLRLKDVSLKGTDGTCYGLLSLPELSPTCNPPFPCVVYVKTSSRCDLDELRHNLTLDENCENNAWLYTDELPQSIEFDAILSDRKTFTIEYTFMHCNKALENSTILTTTGVSGLDNVSNVTTKTSAATTEFMETEAIATDHVNKDVATAESVAMATTEGIMSQATQEMSNGTPAGMTSPLPMETVFLIIAVAFAVFLIMALLVIVYMGRKLRVHTAAISREPKQPDKNISSVPSDDIEMAQSTAESSMSTLDTAPLKVNENASSSKNGPENTTTEPYADSNDVNDKTSQKSIKN